jgi:hypothetical protein
MSAWRAVFWAFLGIRRGQDLETDAHELTPGRVIAAGLAGAALLVLMILALVWWVTR